MEVQLKLNITYTNRSLNQSLKVKLVNTVMVMMDIMSVFLWFALY